MDKTESKNYKCKSLQVSSSNNEYKGNRNSILSGILESGSLWGFGSYVSNFFAFMSILAFRSKKNSDTDHIENDCDEVTLDEIKDILGERFEQVNKGVDRNYGSIRENLEAIHRNYQAIKHVRDKVEKNLVAIKSGFMELTHQFNKAQTEDITSKLITFIEHFELKQRALKNLPSTELINELKEENGILRYLQMTKLQELDYSLYGLLNVVINRQFAIPKSTDDETAIATLYLLCLGTKTYVSILLFLLSGYNYLADNSCQQADIEACNQYLSISLRTLKTFTSTLNGIGDKEGLIGKVIDVLQKVKGLNFVKNEKRNTDEFISRQIADFNEIKHNLVVVNDLPDNKQGEQIRYRFTDSAIRTPFNEWQDRRRVSYAIQYMNNGVYLQVGDWSLPYTVYGKACPVLDIGVAPEGITRLIFRKFDSDKPELVGIVEDNNKMEFRDIHRELYNSALETNEHFSVININTLIDNGANVSSTFEKERQAVHAAAQAGNLESLLLLMNRGASINAQDGNGYTPLHIAALSGYENFIKELIGLGADVDITSFSKWTALHVAAERGYVNVVKSLLQTKGINTNAETVGGFTPLHLAATSNKNGVVITLCSDERINVNAQSERSLTPLHLATLGGYEQVVESLLSNNKIDANLGSQGNLTALHLASIAGNTRTVEQLIGYNQTDINATSEEGWTPLHLAVSSNKIDVVTILCSDERINVNAQSAISLTPLHLAILSGYERVVESLLSNKKIDVNLGSQRNLTALHLATIVGNMRIAEQLIGYNQTDINATSDEGWTPLHLAVSLKSESITRILLNSTKIDVNIEGNILMPLHLDSSTRPNDILLELLDKKSQTEKSEKGGYTALCLAVKEGYLDTVKLLIEKGSNVNIRSKKDESPFFLALCHTNIDVIQYFIDGNIIDINVLDDDENTLLHYAAHKGCLKIVQYLIDSKLMNLNVTNKQGETPLHLAASGGMLEVVKYFVDTKGADFSMKSARRGDTNTPLHLASREGQLEVVKYLIDNKKMDINIRNWNDETPLQLAILNGNLEVIKYLVEDKQSLFTVKKWTGDTALHLAALSGNLEVLKYLIGLEPIYFNVKNLAGETLLHSAVLGGSIEVVRYLIDEKQMDFNIMNAKGETSLHLAASSGELEIMKYLIDTKGEDFDEKTILGDTPLHYAAFKGQLDVVEYLVNDKEMDINVLNSKGESPLYSAVMGCNLEVLKYLDKSKVAVLHVETDEKSSFLLQYAARYCHFDLVQYLIEDKQVDFNIKTREDDTILHLTVMGNNLEAAKYLIVTKQVDPNVKDKRGYAPLQLAILYGHLEIFKYLIGVETVDLDIKTDEGESLLHLAVMNDDLRIVKCLIETKQIDHKIKNSMGYTPLDYAARYGRKEIFKYLIISDKFPSAHQLTYSSDLTNDQESNIVQRSRRSIEDDRKASEFRKRTGESSFGTGNKTIRAENEREYLYFENKSRKNENKSKIKNKKRVKDSYIRFLKFGMENNESLPSSEDKWKEKGPRIFPRIQDQSEAREHSIQSMKYEVSSYENASFIKWMFYFLGRRNFVKRMIEAEHSSSSHQPDYKKGDLEEKLYWTEKRFKRLKRLQKINGRKKVPEFFLE